MNDFYPEIVPFKCFLLPVDDQHQIYVEQCGNPNGQPVLFIHGGPGGGCSENDRRFFDAEKYHIILFDQRGCGRSLPHGCLENNNTQNLVADIEKIRTKLAIKKWHTFGGSWGTTLVLVYAQTHPTAVKSIVLRGVWLARPEDTHWSFSKGGAARIFADYRQEYLANFPESEHEPSIQDAYNIMIGEDKEAALKVARAWNLWETRCCTLQPNAEYLAAACDDKKAWTTARHEAHFMVNNCFLSENQILNNCDKIKDIPTIIVHGRYDIVCPFDNAWLLHQALPLSTLVISQTAGHASSEPETKSHLIDATRKMLTVTG